MTTCNITMFQKRAFCVLQQRAETSRTNLVLGNWKCMVYVGDNVQGWALIKKNFQKLKRRILMHTLN